MYMNSKLYLEWLEIRLAGMGADNKLESCLYTLLSSSEVLARPRARNDWFLGPVVDSLYEFLCDMEVDGRKGMGIDLDVFKAVGDSAEGTSDEQRAKDLTTKEAYKSWKVD